jgi:predicted nucleic acid-binding protein
VKPQTVYLDTNIVSRIPDPDVTEATANALRDICRSGKCKFVTSETTLKEVRQTPNEPRNAMLQFLFWLIDHVEFHTVFMSGGFGGAPFGTAPFSGDWKDPFFLELRKYFDADDAEHILQAIRANCDFFLTLDKKTILNRIGQNQKEISNLCGPIIFVSPEQLLALMKATCP